MKTFKHYTYDRLLGKGGMAMVYLADDAQNQRQVALKLIHERISKDAQFKKRFHHEYEAHHRLVHPNIVAVFDGPEYNDQLFMAVEYIDGWTLQDFYQSQGALPPPLAAFIIREVLKGLAYTHDNGTIHRDIKPANVMISRITGEVKIADFGIVKAEDQTMLTQAGEIVGTPAYMSPEQAMGKKIDQRTDIYSAGAMLYELIAGENPFLDNNIANVIMKVIKANYPPIFEAAPHISDQFAHVVQRMMAKDSAQRYATAQEAIAAVEQVMAAYGPPASQEYFTHFLSDPNGYRDRIQKYLSDWHLGRAKNFTKERILGQAMVECYRAMIANEDNNAARDLLSQIAGQQRMNVDTAAETSAIISLETRVEKNPLDLAALQALAQEHQKSRNFFEAIQFYKKVLWLSPTDTAAKTQLSQLLGISYDMLISPPPVSDSSSFGLKRDAPSNPGTNPPSNSGGDMQRSRPSIPLPFKEISADSTKGRPSGIASGQGSTRQAPSMASIRSEMSSAPMLTGSVTIANGLSPAIVAVIAVAVGLVGFLGGWMVGSKKSAASAPVAEGSIALSTLVPNLQRMTDAGQAQAVILFAQSTLNSLPATQAVPDLHAALAQAYEKVGDKERAIHSWRVAVAQAPKGSTLAAVAEQKIQALGQQQ